MQAYNPLTGATTEEYVAALTLNNAMGAVLIVKNTHASETMYYKVDVYLANTDSALKHEFVSETGLAAETATDPIVVTYPFAKMVVSVKQNSGAGTYQIDPATY